MTMMPQPWMSNAAQRAEAIFASHGLKVSLGGEPTFVPMNPEGAEWNYSAVGPQKLEYARAFARELIARFLPGGTAFYSPGKLYPGEPNPRWALRILYPQNGDPRFPSSVPVANCAAFRKHLASALGLPLHWEFFENSGDLPGGAWAVLLDHDGTEWRSEPWNIRPKDRVLRKAEGPAGLRLPLDQLRPEVPRRSLTVEISGEDAEIFFPPLLSDPFLELLGACHKLLAGGRRRVNFLGYLPPAQPEGWNVIGLASDPGVLEINLPPCGSWREYAEWMDRLEVCAKASGMRAWRQDRGEYATGTGGGNHFLLGSPAGCENAFHANPAWVAGIVAFWQRHPCLSYLFTGDYVGASSQAPRADESGIPVRELELALVDLCRRDSPPTPYELSETLKHLLVDSSGNSHRAEISLDKFFDPNHPAGLLGLVEFRAIESLPDPAWSAAVALLWISVAAHVLESSPPEPPQDFGRSLHDRFFLPSILWKDLQRVLASCRKSGIKLDSGIFRQIWEWKFPQLLQYSASGGCLELRKSHESWPLLAETPLDGGTTSRFVDSSLRRIEFCADAEFAENFVIFVNRLPLPLKKLPGVGFLAGLRFRSTNLYPSLHPRVPVQLPLQLDIVRKSDSRSVASFVLNSGESSFQKKTKRGRFFRASKIPPGEIFSGSLTRDLRY